MTIQRIFLLRRSWLRVLAVFFLATVPLAAAPVTTLAEENAPAEISLPSSEGASVLEVPGELQSVFAGGSPEGVEDLKAMEQHIQKLSRLVTAATVGLQIGPSQGSGVIISKDGYVLTAAHVSGAPGRKVSIILPDGKSYGGKTLGVNRAIDAGLIKIEAKRDWPFVAMGDSSKVKLGQWCLAVGHPGGYQKGRTPVVRVGRVLVKRDTVLASDCTLVGGDSGGPLFDMSGRVIGIHSRIGTPLVANMHVPVDPYRDGWERLAKGDAFGFRPGQGPFIGVVGDRESQAAKIIQVQSGSPAEKAGIEVGDVIKKFGDVQIDSFEALASEVQKHSPGDRVAVEVERDGKTIQLKLTVGRRSG